MGGRLVGVSGSIRTAFGGTPHTYKTNPVAIWGYGCAHLTPWMGGRALQDLWGHILESQFFSFPSFFDQERYADRHARSMKLIFLLEALEYPECTSFDVSDNTKLRALVKWLEDRKIRFAPVGQERVWLEVRGALHAPSY